MSNNMHLNARLHEALRDFNLDTLSALRMRRIMGEFPFCISDPTLVGIHGAKLSVWNDDDPENTMIEVELAWAESQFILTWTTRFVHNLDDEPNYHQIDCPKMIKPRELAQTIVKELARLLNEEN